LIQIRIKAILVGVPTFIPCFKYCTSGSNKFFCLFYALLNLRNPNSDIISEISDQSDHTVITTSDNDAIDSDQQFTSKAVNSTKGPFKRFSGYSEYPNSSRFDGGSVWNCLPIMLTPGIRVRSLEFTASFTGTEILGMLQAWSEYFHLVDNIEISHRSKKQNPEYFDFLKNSKSKAKNAKTHFPNIHFRNPDCAHFNAWTQGERDFAINLADSLAQVKLSQLTDIPNSVSTLSVIVNKTRYISIDENQPAESG
jgi:hypothetical protein